MKFGKQLTLKAHPDWMQHYVDYARLKKLIRSGQQESPRKGQPICAEATAIDAFTTAFIEEIQKVAAFYSITLETQNEKYKQLQQSLANTTEEVSKQWTEDVSGVCQTFELLIHYAQLNTLGFTKILKKSARMFPETVKLSLMPKVTESPISKSSDLEKILSEAKMAWVQHQPQQKEGTGQPEAMDDIPGWSSDIPIVASLDLDSLPASKVTRLWVAIGVNGLSEPIQVPVMVAKGYRFGPIFGITAALHGNELNGIPLIHRLFREMDCSTLTGTVVAVLVANSPGYLRAQRGYSDGSDLNRLMPGKPNGTSAQVYAYNLMQRIVNKFNVLVDLHTASTGRVNSLYVRANMNDPITRRMALLQHPQIILHNTGPDGSLRGAACEKGIASITVEIGDPQTFQKRFIKYALLGVENILCSFNMVPRDAERPDYDPVVCTKSFWMFSTTGGVLTVLPEVNTWVRKDTVIARIHTIFGDLVEEYRASEDAIVIGKSVNPVCQSGDRIIHLGVVGSDFLSKSNDGHL